MPTLSGEDPIPTEIIIRIYGELSFTDAFNLAATCRQLRLILDTNTPTIYKRLRKQISGEKYARLLLVDQGSLPSTSSALGTHHLRRLRRNSRRVEKAIDKFDHVILPDIQSECIYDSSYHRHLAKLHSSQWPQHTLVINIIAESLISCI